LTVICDLSKHQFFIEHSFFQKHEHVIKNYLLHFSLEEKEKGYVLQLPGSFPSKTILPIVSKGEEKEESSCRFCSKRVKCLTTNWNCQNYELSKPYVYEINEVISFFEHLTPILYVKGV